MTDIYIKIIDKCGIHRKCANRQLPDNCTTFFCVKVHLNGISDTC